MGSRLPRGLAVRASTFGRVEWDEPLATPEPCPRCPRGWLAARRWRRRIGCPSGNLTTHTVGLARTQPVGTPATAASDYSVPARFRSRQVDIGSPPCSSRLRLQSHSANLCGPPSRHYAAPNSEVPANAFRGHCQVERSGRGRQSHQPHASHMTWGFTRMHRLKPWSDCST